MICFLILGQFRYVMVNLKKKLQRCFVTNKQTLYLTYLSRSLAKLPAINNKLPESGYNQSNADLPWTAKTLQGWVPWRDDSLFPPLMKAGRLGLLWSPTNFPGCCPIRAGCQAAAGTLQAGRSCSPCKKGPPSSEWIWRIRMSKVSCVDLWYCSKSVLWAFTLLLEGSLL